MQNDINDAKTVVYNEKRLQSLKSSWGIDYLKECLEDNNAMTLFINGNNPNVNDVPRENFEELVSFTNVNDRAFPVLLYTNGDEMVAWYDMENLYGYITKHTH